MEKGAGSVFWEMTKYQHLGRSDQMKGMRSPALEVSHGGRKIISLPRPEKIRVKATDLRAAIEGRRSVRLYGDDPLGLEELSFLLWCTQGVKEMIPGEATLRNVPSAGARHALETYLLINRVAGLAPGLYHFTALGHGLSLHSMEPRLADEISRACFGQETVKGCAVLFIWTAVPYRMNWRYGERGYRYLLLDAGHCCQNLYLAGEAVGCGVCAVAAFSDDDMNGILGVHPDEQFVCYLAAVGCRQKE